MLRSEKRPPLLRRAPRSRLLFAAAAAGDADADRADEEHDDERRNAADRGADAARRIRRTGDKIAERILRVDGCRDRGERLARRVERVEAIVEPIRELHRLLIGERTARAVRPDLRLDDGVALDVGGEQRRQRDIARDGRLLLRGRTQRRSGRERRLQVGDDELVALLLVEELFAAVFDRLLQRLAVPVQQSEPAVLALRLQTFAQTAAEQAVQVGAVIGQRTSHAVVDDAVARGIRPDPTVVGVEHGVVLVGEQFEARVKGTCAERLLADAVFELRRPLDDIIFRRPDEGDDERLRRVRIGEIAAADADRVRPLRARIVRRVERDGDIVLFQHFCGIHARKAVVRSLGVLQPLLRDDGAVGKAGAVGILPALVRRIDEAELHRIICKGRIDGERQNERRQNGGEHGRAEHPPDAPADQTADLPEREAALFLFFHVLSPLIKIPTLYTISAAPSTFFGDRAQLPPAGGLHSLSARARASSRSARSVPASSLLTGAIRPS